MTERVSGWDERMTERVSGGYGGLEGVMEG